MSGAKPAVLLSKSQRKNAKKREKKKGADGGAGGSAELAALGLTTAEVEAKVLYRIGPDLGTPPTVEEEISWFVEQMNLGIEYGGGDKDQITRAKKGIALLSGPEPRAKKIAYMKSMRPEYKKEAAAAKKTKRVADYAAAKEAVLVTAAVIAEAVAVGR